MQTRNNHRVFQLGGGNRSRVTILASLVLLSLLVASQFSQVSVATSTPLPKSPATSALAAPTQSILLRRDSYRGFELDSFSNATTVSYAAFSDAPISVALMTGAQYDSWQNNPNDPISNSVTYQNGTDVQNSVTIQQGQYFLVFYSYFSRALVQFGFQISPSTPYSYGPLANNLASGIASFGITNSSGSVTPYQIRTSQIVGTANISSFQVNTPDAFRYGTSVTGASLQLNAMLVVNDSGTSSQKVYWVQNVPDFVTGASQVSIGDEIWNNTDSSGFLSNQTISSINFQNGGFVYQSSNNPRRPGPYLYAYSLNNETYALPLDFALLMKAIAVPGVGVSVQLGYRLLSNGSSVASPTVWYDNVTIHDPSVKAAYFEVSGTSAPPTGLYYDAEFVFAGEGNTESAYFTNLNATLGLFYQNDSSGVLSSFPTFYSFSGDTGEAADNLVVTFKNGIAQVAPGAIPNYSYLGSSSLTLNPSSMTVSSPPTSRTTSTTRSITTTSTTSVSTPSVMTSTTSVGIPAQPLAFLPKASGSQSISVSESYLLLICAAALAVLVVGAFFLANSRKRPVSLQPAQESV